MPADGNVISNPQDHHFAIDSDDESSNSVDKFHEAIGDRNAIHQHEYTPPADQQLPNNGVVDLSSVQEASAPLTLETPKKKPKEVVTWMSLPHKRQLAILTVARLSEPLVQTSLQSYMFYQLKSFDKSLPDSVIASQAGIMQGSFTAAQFLTAMMWGRIADSDRGGRKTVLLIGLFGTSKAKSSL
jgi:hypothetical protein